MKTCSKCMGAAEEKVFSTFRYWYCETCRVEVTDEPDVSFDSTGGIRIRPGYTFYYDGMPYTLPDPLAYGSISSADDDDEEEDVQLQFDWGKLK
jgi:hypothetical protein